MSGYTRWKFAIRMSMLGWYCAFITIEMVVSALRFAAPAAVAARTRVATTATATCAIVYFLRLLKAEPPSGGPPTTSADSLSAKRSSDRLAAVQVEEVEPVDLDAERDGLAGPGVVGGV